MRIINLIIPPKLLTTFLICCIFILIPSFYFLKNSFDNSIEHNKLWASGGLQGDHSLHKDIIMGEVIMGKLGNETAKAEVGRASWKLLHTMAARFPLKPTPSEREAYSSFLYLFSRVYPCGECAQHFQHLLKLHPPQTSSRNAASVHLCYLHNLVNERLGKEEFDCGVGLEGLYDCGCGDEPLDSIEGGGVGGSSGKKKVMELVADIDDDIIGNKGDRIDPVTGEKLIGG